MFLLSSDQVNSALDAVVAADLPMHTAGLFEFAEGLMHLDTQRDGFAGPDVASVEAKWGYADANFYWCGGYVVRLRDGRRAYIEGTSVPEFSEDGETYELQWTFDVRFLADEPYHSLTPLQSSEHRPYTWEEAPASLNEFLNRLAAEDDTNA
jgi:hypothetical protein